MLERVNGSRHTQVASLRKAGFTYAEIGRKLGLTRERIRQIANAETRPGMQRIRRNILSIQSDAALVAVDQPHDHVKAGGFTGAIGAQQTHNLTAVDAERNLLYHLA